MKICITYDGHDIETYFITLVRLVQLVKGNKNGSVFCYYVNEMFIQSNLSVVVDTASVVRGSGRYQKRTNTRNHQAFHLKGTQHDSVKIKIGYSNHFVGIIYAKFSRPITEVHVLLLCSVLQNRKSLEANEGANITHNQNLKLVIWRIEKHNITEIIKN